MKGQLFCKSFGLCIHPLSQTSSPGFSLFTKDPEVKVKYVTLSSPDLLKSNVILRTRLKLASQGAWLIHLCKHFGWISNGVANKNVLWATKPDLSIFHGLWNRGFMLLFQPPQSADQPSLHPTQVFDFWQLTPLVSNYFLTMCIKWVGGLPFFTSTLNLQFALNLIPTISSSLGCKAIKLDLEYMMELTYSHWAR